MSSLGSNQPIQGSNQPIHSYHSFSQKDLEGFSLPPPLQNIDATNINLPSEDELGASSDDIHVVEAICPPISQDENTVSEDAKVCDYRRTLGLGGAAFILCVTFGGGAYLVLRGVSRGKLDRDSIGDVLEGVALLLIAGAVGWGGSKLWQKKTT